MSFWPFQNKAKARAEASDYGRTFGWYVERDGIRIAELEYLRWDDHAQFWHDYAITWLVSQDQQIAADPDEWIRQKLSLRNRHYSDVLIPDFLTAHHNRPDGVVSIRYASVPIERFSQE